MASDAAHEESIRLMLECPEIDALVCKCGTAHPDHEKQRRKKYRISLHSQNRIPKIFAETQKTAGSGN